MKQRPAYLVRLCLILICLGLLAACGQKGPLYLPDPEPDQETDANG